MLLHTKPSAHAPGNIFILATVLAPSNRHMSSKHIANIRLALLTVAEGNASHCQQYFRRLLCCHPQYIQKGLNQAVYVQPNPTDWRGLVAVMPDGGLVTFSYAKCFPNRNRSNETKKALRNEVLSQTRCVRFQSNAGGDEGLHVGHVGQHEFDQIVAMFLKEERLSIADIQVTHMRQREYHLYKSPYLQDNALADRFRQFHQKNAELVMQTKEDNLSGNAKHTLTE